MVTPWTVCCPRCGASDFSMKYTYEEGDGAFVEEYTTVRCEQCNMRFIITISYSTLDMQTEFACERNSNVAHDMKEGEGDGTE